MMWRELLSGLLRYSIRSLIDRVWLASDDIQDEVSLSREELQL